MQERQAWRVLHVAFWLPGSAAVFYAPLYAQRGQLALALSECVALGVMAVAYGLAVQLKRPMAGLQAIAVIGWLLLAVLIVLNGGLRSPAVAWIILLPPMLMLAHARLALAMTVATVLFMAGLYVAEQFSWLLAVQEVPLAQRALSAVLVASLFTVFSWFALHSRVRLATELDAARGAAIEANRLNERFIANLNHEIRTPMNALVAGARLLGRKNVGAEQQSLVQAMQRSADHLLALVNDVLDHSRLEAREMRFDPIEFSLRDLTASALEMFGAVAQSKEIALRLDHDETIHDVWIGDPTRLRQVLANLLSNAVKFTPWRGQVVLRVSPAMAPGGGTALRFEVQDSGPGISAQTQARLFKPYEQGDASITRRYGGTGLGLSICKELLRLMQGTIEVESKLGVGSTFRVLVPIERAIANLHHPLTTRAMDHAMLPVDLTVLLVEDDAVNRMVMEAVLRDIGVKVLTAESGERALDLLERASIGLVLMDCQMPDMDGLTTTRRWRSKEATRQRARVPVIALTGEAHSGARLACLDAGMDDYLTKPVSGRDLNAMLARWATPRSPALARH